MDSIQFKLSKTSGAAGNYLSKLKSIASGKILFCVLIYFLLLLGQKAFGQGVGISEVSITPDTWSILELRSTQRGFLTPRMTTVQRTTLGTNTPTAGMLVYDIDLKSFYYYD